MKSECRDGQFRIRIAGALINLGFSIPAFSWLLLDRMRRGEFASIPQGLDQLPVEKKFAVLLGWPLVLAPYVYTVFLATGVSTVVGRKEYFPNFETSDVQLYFRTLFGTGLCTIAICCLIGGTAFITSVAIVRFFNRHATRFGQAS